MSELHDTPLAAYTPSQLQIATRSIVGHMDYGFTGKSPSHWMTLAAFSQADIDVVRNEGVGGLKGFRRPHHIRADKFDDFWVSIPRSALITLTQSGKILQLEPGTFAFCASALPCSFEVNPVDRHEIFSTMHIRISGPLLRRLVPQIDSFCYRPIRLGPGAGRIMLGLFDHALSDGYALSETQARNFASMMIGAVANVASGASEFSYLSAPRPSSFEKIRSAAKDFVERNLSNAALDSAMVARHCGVSIRYLQRAFADDAQSLGAYIRDTRLQRCNMALQNPALRHRPIFDIAMMWGFRDPSYFNRAYKKQFGSVPGKARPAN